ncbi:FxSxx-COOH system tetratricopeptide repeat protein [Streptomyces sp. NPDC050085]|uniref:FxSxx-COOH system tetratricopeptide repeat protein n=1 Tax=Streptomyces sp. NPDC050085 TaxID=3365600 RepID=UPI0037AC550A
MIGNPGEAPVRPAGPAGVAASRGGIGAGRDVNNAVTQYVERLIMLPPEANTPIPDDAAQGGVSNIGTGLFVGRVDELGSLDEAFARPGEVVVHAVHGLGGVGKSALAARWAAGRHEKVRWWITADSAAAVDTGLAALAGALQPGLIGLPAELQSERAVAWLACHDGWLLVLDNVEDLRHIRPLIGRVPGGRVLVTTRRATGWHHDATAIHLGVFEPADAVDLFTRILTHPGTHDTDGADAVCEELGHLALAVEQAASYCAETGTVPRAYLDMLKQWPATMFASGTLGGDSERTIARIWHLTLNRLDATPLAADVLRILAWYAPDSIPRSLLHGLAEPPRLATAIGHLTAYSMLTDNHDGTVTVHRLVQALARTPDPEDPHRTPALIEPARRDATARLRAALPDSWEDPASWPVWRTLVPHIAALAAQASPETDTADTLAVLSQVGLFVDDQGSTQSAIAYHARALTAALRVLGADHPDTLSSRQNLAEAYKSAGDLDRAVPLFEQNLTDRTRVLGQDHPETLDTRHSLANCRGEAGDLAGAVDELQRLLIDARRVLGDDRPDVLAARGNLAAWRGRAGDLAGAVDGFAQLLADRIRVLGQDDRSTFITRANLANWQGEAGDPAGAAHSLGQLLPDQIRVLGHDHPDTLITRANLANWQGKAGDPAGAAHSLGQLLPDQIRVLGHDHPDTLITRASLANWQGEAGDPAGAAHSLGQLLPDQIRVLGHNHPDTLTTRANLANWQGEAGDPAGAAHGFGQLLLDHVRVLGHDHPHTLTTRYNLAYWLITRGRELIEAGIRSSTEEGSIEVPGTESPDASSWFTQALLCFEEALELTDPVENPGLYGIIQHDIAETHRAAGDLRTAATHYRLSLEHQQAGDDPGNLVTTMIALGDCLIGCGELTQARAAMDETQDFLGQAAHAMEPARRAVRLHGLGQSYELLGSRGQETAYDKALSNYQEALGLIPVENDPVSYGTVLQNIGDVHRAQDRLTEAHTSYTEAADHMRRGDSPQRNLVSVLLDLGRVRRRIGSLHPETSPDGDGAR